MTSTLINIHPGQSRIRDDLYNMYVTDRRQLFIWTRQYRRPNKISSNGRRRKPKIHTFPKKSRVDLFDAPVYQIRPTYGCVTRKLRLRPFENTSVIVLLWKQHRGYEINQKPHNYYSPRRMLDGCESENHVPSISMYRILFRCQKFRRVYT